MFIRKFDDFFHIISIAYEHFYIGDFPLPIGLGAKPLVEIYKIER